MTKTILKVLKYALTAIAVFFGTQLSFKLLNLASTVGNIIGFLLLLYIVTFIIFHSVKKIKNYLNEE